MRILKFIFGSVLVVGVLAAVTAVIAREALLLWATSMVQSSLTQLQFYSKNPQTYNNQCKAKGTLNAFAPIQHFQLRFTDSTTYVAEVICDQFPTDPIVIEKHTLPPLVQKAAGSGGIIWGDDRSGVVLEIFGRRTAVVVDQKNIQTAAATAPLGTTTPQTTCGGFGYTCCDSEVVQGMGQTYGDVLDCPKTCYSVCSPRPVVLSFASDPFPDNNSRNVTLHAGESVTFSYVVSVPPGQSGPNKVTLEYGDGQQDISPNLTNQFSHQYACSAILCVYTAKLHITTASGTVSADTPITMLNIRVTL